MRRPDFVFSIGYTGGTAIIDRRLLSQYSRFSTRQLAEAGLFKAALAGALWDDKADDMEFVLQAYNKATTSPLPSIEALRRALGVGDVYRKIQRTTYL